MTKTTLTYITLLLVLCAASYWCGTRHREIEEVKVEIDTTIVEDPPPVEVKPTEVVVVDRLPVVNYDKLKDQILDSLVAAGYILDTVNIVDLPNILPDSLDVEIPMSQSIFKGEQFEIAVTAYNPTLDYAKIFNSTTTLRSPLKGWALNASLDSFTSHGTTELSVGLNAEYSINNWAFSGGYQVGFNGQGGVVLGVEYRLW
ncbi:MAG: hypothetical protein R3Y08_08315 [Rikenellaceae bacterium]